MEKISTKVGDFELEAHLYDDGIELRVNGFYVALLELSKDGKQPEIYVLGNGLYCLGTHRNEPVRTTIRGKIVAKGI